MCSVTHYLAPPSNEALDEDLRRGDEDATLSNESTDLANNLARSEVDSGINAGPLQIRLRCDKSP